MTDSLLSYDVPLRLPEIVKVYLSIVRSHDGDVRDRDGDIDDHGDDVDGHDGAIDDGVSHSNSVAHYTGRHSEDSRSDLMVAQEPPQGDRCEYRPLPSQGRHRLRPPTTRAWQ
jgi:hypothetical protein